MYGPQQDAQIRSESQSDVSAKVNTQSVSLGAISVRGSARMADSWRPTPWEHPGTPPKDDH